MIDTQVEENLQFIALGTRHTHRGSPTEKRGRKTTIGAPWEVFAIGAEVYYRVTGLQNGQLVLEDIRNSNDYRRIGKWIYDRQLLNNPVEYKPSGLVTRDQAISMLS